MKKESINFLGSLIDSISPSGYEGEAVKVWRDITKNFVDSIKSDIHGNVMAVLNKDQRPRVMLAGHIDEIGYMVKYIDKEGYIYFSPVGGIDPQLIPGQRVWIKTKNGRVLGAIGRKPIHILEETEKKKVPRIEELWIDIGARDEKETKNMIEVGNIAVPAVGFEALNADKVVGRGFDNKAGAFVVSETLRLLSRKRPRASVYGVATVQEEIGLRGAKTSAYGISPDIGLAIDVTFATDFPGVNKKKIGDIKIGGGPVIARGPNINPKIFELLIKMAKKEKIPYQIEAISRGTGTDANAIQLTKAGIATGLISIPCRYVHTPVEVISLRDLENTIRLLKAFILKLDRKFNFKPY